MSKRYVFLFNLDTIEESKTIDTLKKLFPDNLIYDYGYNEFSGKPELHNWEGYISIWVRKKDFTSAYLITNLFPDFEFVDEITVADAHKVLKSRLKHKEYIKKL